MKDNHKVMIPDDPVVVELPGGDVLELPPGSKVLDPVAKDSQSSSGSFVSRHDLDNTLRRNQFQQATSQLKLLEGRRKMGGRSANAGKSSDGKSDRPISLGGNDKEGRDETSTDDSEEETSSGISSGDTSSGEDSAGSIIDRD